jgi:Ribbon-helix-helix domain
VPNQTRGNARTPVRRGTPLTVYFSDQQTMQLNNISRQRRVPKAELLRIAVDLLVNQLNDGQLQLPLGVDIQTTMPEFRGSK